MKPSQLLPGDFLLYRNHGWLGNLIAWGSWSNRPQEALEYSHIGIVLDADQSAEMNPPGSRAFPLAEVPWDRVDVFRAVDKDGVDVFGPVMSWGVLKAIAVSRLGEKYAYGYIAQSLGVGLLARIGLPGLSRWLTQRANPFPAKRQDVCSTWAEEVAAEACRAVLSDPSFDLFPDLGADRAKPSDFPRSPFVRRIL